MTANPSEEAAAPASPISALTEPTGEAGRSLYDRLAPAIGWYFEHLEDLAHEAKASRAAARAVEGITASDVLAGLATAKIASKTAGRVRLKVPALKAQDQLADQVGQALARVPGVTNVSVSSLLGTALIEYDARRIPSIEALLASVDVA